MVEESRTARLRGRGIRIVAKASSHAQTDLKSIPETETLSKLSDYDKYINDPNNSINRFTVNGNLMPAWMAHSAYIHRGYRRLNNSVRGCLLSLGYLHNETGNVYTHLLGFLAILPLTYYSFFYWMQKYATVNWKDYVVQLVFVIGLETCLACSTVFHLCCCHSRHMFGILSRMDYIGIVFLQV